MKDHIPQIRTREVTVSEWQKLCENGAVLNVRITLNGNSMLPLIRKDRDRVVIIPVNRPLEIGDVVLFLRSDGSYVVHRLYKITDGFVQTLGDGCLSPDTPIKAEAICGIVIKAERGRLVFDLDSPASRFFGRIWMYILPVRKNAARIKRFIRRRIRHG